MLRRTSVSTLSIGATYHVFAEVAFSDRHEDLRFLIPNSNAVYPRDCTETGRETEARRAE